MEKNKTGNEYVEKMVDMSWFDNAETLSIEQLLEINIEELSVSCEFKNEIMLAINLTNCIGNATNSFGHECLSSQFDYSSLVVIWNKTLEKMLRRIYVPVLKQYLPDYKFPPRPGKEEIAVSNIEPNEFTVGLIIALLNRVHTEKIVFNNECDALNMQCYRRLKSASMRKIRDVNNDALHNDISWEKAIDFAKCVVEEIKYWSNKNQ